MLIREETVSGVEIKRVYGNTLCFPLNFSVNLKLYSEIGSVNFFKNYMWILHYISISAVIQALVSVIKN